MKGYFVFLLLTFSLGICLVVGGGVILPPPTPDETETEDPEGKGVKNGLGTFQISKVKCSVEGSYGIKNECQKYLHCPKKGGDRQTMFCSTNLSFDHKERICMSSSSAKCQNVCKTEGQMFVDPKFPGGFLKCKLGVPMSETCPTTGHTFQADKMACGITPQKIVPDDDD